MKKKQKYNLDPEEQELLDSFERGEWVTVPNFEKEKELARKRASLSLRKDVRINIRLSSTDVEHIKERAAYEGLPYQTLISSILHKFAAGHLQFG